MHRFAVATVLRLSKPGVCYQARRYLVTSDVADTVNTESDLLATASPSILLSIWLSGCGRFYFIILDVDSGKVRRERAKG